MKRLIEKTVFWGLVAAWRLATVPTRRSPEAVKATTDGVVRPPSAFSMTVGSPPSSTAMHELVVPRSIPIVFAILKLLLLVRQNLSQSVADFNTSVQAGLAHRDRRSSLGWHLRPAARRPGTRAAWAAPIRRNS